MAKIKTILKRKEKLRELIEQGLINARVILDIENKRINIVTLILQRINQAGWDLEWLLANPDMRASIITHIQEQSHKLHSSTRLKWENPQDNDKLDLDKDFIKLVNDAIDAAIVDFKLQQKFADNPEAIQLIKSHCQQGIYSKVKNPLALLLASKIDQSMPPDEIKKILQSSLYKNDRQMSDEEALMQAGKLGQMIDVLFKIIEEKEQLPALISNHFRKEDMIHLKDQLTTRQRQKIFADKRTEFYQQITEVAGESSELTKIIGEFAEKTHHFLHITEVSAKSITKTGGIGSLISGALGVIIIPIGWALKGKKPKLKQKYVNDYLHIGASLAMIVLGALAIAAVGGPIGIGVFVLTATVIGFTKTAISFWNEWRERKHLEGKIKGFSNGLNTLREALEAEKTKMENLSSQLTEELAKPPNQIDQEQIKQLRIKLMTSYAIVRQLSQEIDQKTLIFVKRSAELIELKEKRRSRWELAKKVIYSVSGILGMVGGAMMIVPVAPVPVIGVMLMLTASLLSVGAIVGSLVVKKIKERWKNCVEQKTKALKDNAEKEEIELSNGLEQSENNRFRSSDFKISAKLFKNQSEMKMDKFMLSKTKQLDENIKIINQVDDKTTQSSQHSGNQFDHFSARESDHQPKMI